MTPAAIHLSRAEFMPYPKNVFRDFLYHELRNRKEHVRTNKSGKPLNIKDDDGGNIVVDDEEAGPNVI